MFKGGLFLTLSQCCKLSHTQGWQGARPFEKMRQEKVREVSPLVSSSLCSTHSCLKASHFPGKMGHLGGLTMPIGLEKDLCIGPGVGGQGSVVKGR